MFDFASLPIGLTPLIPAGPATWGLALLAGQITELSAQGGSATATVAMRLVWEAQRQGEAAAWITDRSRCFFPPDAVANGVDLAALAVVRVPDAQHFGRAADTLVRSGAFALVVIDMGGIALPGPGARARGSLGRGVLAERHLVRLLGLARKHETAVVCLVEKADVMPSLGAAVALRGAVRYERERPGEFAYTVQVLKDKRRPAGWGHRERCNAPPGLH